MISMTVDLASIDADEAINARRTRSDEGLDELKASIVAHGLIQPLRVRTTEEGGRYLIVAGHRRHRVLCELAASGDMAGGVPVTPDFQVPVLIGHDDAAAAREISQAENFIRLPQHEADTYETFRELADRGLTEGQIAARFGIEPKRVRRMLALGRLAPCILEAWRDGTFEKFRGAADTVRAFTLAPSAQEQEKVFRKLLKDGQLWPHTIRQAFGAGDREVAKNLTFVGAKAYAAAGGSVVEDLFGEDHAVSDPAVLKKLADEKLQDKAADVAQEGWSWVALAGDLPSGWSWSWQKLPLSKKKATKEQKAKSGAVLAIDHKGKLEITYGVVKPGEAKKEKAKSDGSKEKAEPAISNAMTLRLSVGMTEAVQKALPADPRVALAALVAGLESREYDRPVKIRKEGLGEYEAVRDAEPWAAIFGRLVTMTADELMLAAACAMSKSIDFRIQNAGGNISPGHRALLEAIPGDALQGALLSHFDPADYFGGVAKPLVIQAIREAINDDEARKSEKLKKKELVEFAVANVPKTGWLPPELRCATYSGPGAMPEPKAHVVDPPDFDEDLEDEAA
jgi:ParB family transcriptional regulator, chromosome partitioning protein